MQLTHALLIFGTVFVSSFFLFKKVALIDGVPLWKESLKDIKDFELAKGLAKQLSPYKNYTLLILQRFNALKR